MFDGGLLARYGMEFVQEVLWPAFTATLQMMLVSAILSSILGFLLAVLLVVTNEGGMMQNKPLYSVLSFIVNVVRSFPFIILMVVLLPFTKMLVHTSIGVSAAIVPLTIAATAFTARLIETSLLEVDKELLEAMKSFGLTDTQVIFRVMLSEALPAIVSNIVLAMIAILGSTAVAGAVGAGGIGSVALTYGYQRFDEGVMVVTVITLIAMVQVIQVIGNYVYRKLKA